MLKKTIQFENFNGETESDDFYFHLTKSDLARLELGKGGMEEYINRIVKAGNGEEIVAMFEKFIKESYGVRSIDGRRFIKNAEVLEEFTSSAAYDVFFLQLVTDAAFGAEFVNGIMPAELIAEAKALKAVEDNPSISENLAAHLSVAPEPLSEEDFAQRNPVVKPVETRDRDTKKELLIVRMAIRNGQAVRLTPERVEALSEDELEKAIANGSVVDGL